MCGRSRCAASSSSIESSAHSISKNIVNNLKGWVPNQNIHPGNDVPTIVSQTCHHAEGEASCAQLLTMKWGLVPSWTKGKANHFRMFNARAETISTNGVFRKLVQRQRCVVCLDGFYEWKVDGAGEKQPYFVSFRQSQGKSSGMMFLAGIFDVHQGLGLRSATIITTQVSSSMAWLHHRMPVILDEAGALQWIDGDIDLKVALAVLRPYDMATPQNPLQCYPVTKRMNKMDYNEPDCSCPVALVQAKKRTDITSFFKTTGTATVASKKRIKRAPPQSQKHTLAQVQDLPKSIAETLVNVTHPTNVATKAIGITDDDNTMITDDDNTMIDDIEDDDGNGRVMSGISCSRCTFMNRSESWACEMCNEKLASSARTKKTLSNQILKPHTHLITSPVNLKLTRRTPPTTSPTFGRTKRKAPSKFPQGQQRISAFFS